LHSGRDAADNGEGRERGVTSILITDGHELAGLGAARSLGRAGHRVTVAVPQGLSAPVARSRYVAQVIDSPSPWADQAAFRRFLLAEARKYEVLLPVSEAAIAAAATLRAELHPTRLLMPSDDSLRYTLSKYHATKLAQTVGLATPPTVFLLGRELAGLVTRRMIWRRSSSRFGRWAIRCCSSTTIICR
jgi:glutathione synthase/RimK-type ligase-like ATP-grasp enzyme